MALAKKLVKSNIFQGIASIGDGIMSICESITSSYPESTSYKLVNKNEIDEQVKRSMNYYKNQLSKYNLYNK